jgi:hypothetical protein
MTHRPRAERDVERARAAAIAAGAANGSAMDRALAQISAAFGEAAAVNDFKLRIERLFRLGPHHPAVRARFGSRAERSHGADLHLAIGLVERCWRNERKAFQIASAFGYGSRLSLDVLREARLALRLMRFKRMEREFSAIAAALRGESAQEAVAEAAE